MSKGYDAHQQRQMVLSAFGKDLARRCKSKCELTGASGVSLHIYEIPPVSDEPELARCLMICEQAIDQIKQPRLIMADKWRHLGELIWSDIPAIQIMAYRLLKHISQRDQWAREILDEAYLDEEILAEANKESL
ncbi:MAG: phnA protein [Akkermansiaceae bacterium]